MIDKKIIAIAMIMILLVTGCIRTPTGELIVEEKDITIGAVVPLTGWGAYYGVSQLKGMEFAADKINDKGGVNGHRIKIVAQDSKGEGKEAVNNVNMLASIYNPDAMIVSFALPTLAVSPILKENKIPFIYEAYISSPAEQNKYAFKSNYNPVQGCKKMVKFAKENGKYSKLGAIFANTEYNRLCLKGVMEMEQDVAVEWYEFGDLDFKTMIIKQKERGVDGIIMLGLEHEWIPFFKQKDQFGNFFNLMCALSSECITTNTAESMPKRVLEGTIGDDFIDVRDMEFALEFKEKHPDASDSEIFYAAIGYEAVMIIARAMEDCVPGDRECLRESLETVKDYDSVLGSNGFKDRILELKTQLYEFSENQWVKI